MTRIGERYTNVHTGEECYVTRIYRGPGMTMEAMVELTPTAGGEPRKLPRRDFWRDWNMAREG
jgi:hypothetical protein